MRILTLDLASRTGTAFGEAGTLPRLDVWQLRKPDQDVTRAPSALGRCLRDMFMVETPDLLCMERHMEPAAQQHQAPIISGLLLAGAVYAVCACYGVRVIAVSASKVRKHFCNRAHAGSRDETKRMVIKQAVLLGYLPKNSRDEDLADAVALYDWASATHAGKTVSFMLHGEVRA